MDFFTTENLLWISVGLSLWALMAGRSPTDMSSVERKLSDIARSLSAIANSLDSINRRQHKKDEDKAMEDLIKRAKTPSDLGRSFGHPAEPRG